MDKTSITTTATTSLGVAGGAGALEWLWSLLTTPGPHPMPESVALYLVAMLAPLFHIIYNAVVTHLDKAVSLPQSNPTQSQGVK